MHNIGVARPWYVTKPSDARKFPRLPVAYSDLDIGSKGGFRELEMWVSGVKAKGYIDHNHSSRIRILFQEPQSLFSEQEFVTKYFNLDAPGHLVWGKNDENLWILEHRDM